MLLQKDELLKWNKWSNSSKRYIASRKEIQLIAVLREYQGLIADFYQWFYKKTCQIYEKQLRELSILDEEIENLNPSNDNLGVKKPEKG